MVGKRAILLVAVLLSNLAIVAGVVALEWSPLTLVSLFVGDALLGIGRILLERLFAVRPRGDAVPSYGPYPVLDDLFESLLDKRGSIRVSDRIPRVYPGNLPFVLEQWVSLLGTGVLFTTTWFALGPPEGGLHVSLVVVLLAFVTKHSLIIATWASAGVYEQASVATVRPREILYTVLVAWIALVFLAPLPGEYTAIAAILPVAPKLLFDFREAGIGPEPLVFDPSSDTTVEPIPTPAGKPRHVFRTDDRAVFNRAARFGVFYAFWPGLFLIGPIVLIGFLADSLAVILFGIVGGVSITFSISYLVLWLGHANVEYRVYEDRLVAHDQFLDTPQWAISLDDVQTISTGENVLDALRLPPLIPIPFDTVPVDIERSTDEDRRLEYLERPDEFVRTVREISVGCTRK